MANNYIDIFTGQSIGQLGGYNSIDMTKDAVHLFWSQQSLPADNKDQNFLNAYVCQYMEFIKTEDSISAVYLPSSAQMPLGTSFMLYPDFVPSEKRPFVVYPLKGEESVINAITEGDADGYFLYNVNANDNKSSWRVFIFNPLE